MNRNELITDIAQLLERTGHAHHEAYIQVDGSDDDWAVWYADYLQQPLSKRLSRDLTKTEIIRALVDFDLQTQTAGAGIDWKEAYAKGFVERYLAESEEKLSLYHFEGCPFCSRVRRVIDELGVPVELRDVFENPTYRDELMAARGRPTVPVLRCDSDGASRWLPESADIVAYLRQRFGA